MKYLQLAKSVWRRLRLPQFAAPAVPLRADPVLGSGADEFEGFVHELSLEEGIVVEAARRAAESLPHGASAAAEDFDLRDSAIAALQESLQQLQPLGEMLAQAERGRLAAEQRAAELQARLAESERRESEARLAEPEREAELRRQVSRLEQALEKSELAGERERERRAKLRTEVEDRRRVASERARRLRELQAEKRSLIRELAQERRWKKSMLTQARGILSSSPKRAENARSRLSELMGSEPEQALPRASSSKASTRRRSRSAR